MHVSIDDGIGGITVSHQNVDRRYT